jgi:hypothetical protein
MMKKVNILYIECAAMGNPSLNDYKAFIVSIFQAVNHEAYIEIYDQKPDRKNIARIIDDKKIDVIICDLSLGTTMNENSLGLTLVKELKTEFPEIVICGISGKDIGYRDTTNPKNLPTFDLFISKVRYTEEKYKDYIIEEMRRIFRSNTEIEIIKDGLTVEEEKFVDQPFFIRLLKLITFTTHESGPGTNIKTVTLSSTSGGYSSSFVFKMSCQTANGEKVINSILKCSRIKYAHQEMNNYLNYVKWYLPYTWRPEVLSCAFGKDYGMICYSFAYNAEKAFSSITDKIKTADYGKVDEAIEKIFGTKTQKWYSEDKWPPVNVPVNHYYHNIYFQNGRNKPFEFIENLIMNLGGHKKNDEYHIFNATFPTVEKLITESITHSYRECICHGDLNTNNILTSDESEELIFIDFQETKEGHVFHDFVVFEMCFRIYCETGFSFEKLLEIETEAVNDNFEAIGQYGKIWDRVKRVRELAKENFPNEEIKTYYYGMAMRAFRLFRSHEKFEPWQLEAILSVLLANLKKLYI